jgi:hypothetical protein
LTRIIALDPLDVRFPTSRERDGSDAMNLDPDYSAAYVVLATILLHNYTLHMSEPNTTLAPRRAFSVCYIDGATRQTGTERGFPQVFPEYRPADDKARVTVDY